ncbi:hypothetical protein Tco_0309520 [Tanacetum coccineum]
MQNMQGRQTQSYTRNNAAIGKVRGNTRNKGNVKGYRTKQGSQLRRKGSLEAFDSECEEELNTTSLFMANRVDAFDSDCDDDLTASAIFMPTLSHARSVTDNDDGPSYDTDAMSEVPIYDKYDMFNPFVHETSLSEQPASINDTYLEITNDSNIYSDTLNTITNEDDVVEISRHKDHINY